MASKYTKDMLSLDILFSDEDSDFEDLFLLPELGKRLDKHAEQAERRARHGKRLDIATLPPDQCKSLFRFEKCDIPGLVEALDLPQELVGSNRTRCTGLEGLCILLRRLAYPNRLEDIEGVLGRGVSELSVIIKYKSWSSCTTSGIIFWTLCLLLG